MMPSPRLPLSRYALFRTTDLDQAREEVGKIFCPHRLATVSSSRLDACHHSVDLGGFSLNYVQYGADVVIEPGELGSFFLLQIPLAGGARIRIGGSEMDASPSVASLLSPTLPVRMQWSDSCAKLLVQIPRTAVERTLQDMLGRRLRAPIAFAPALPMDAGAGQRIAQIVHLLREDIESDAAMFLAAGAGPQMRETLICALLRAVPHNYSAMLHAPAPTVVPRHVRLAEETMRARLAEPLTVMQIAEAAGVSVRSLQEGFRRFRDMTPIEALHTLRLDGARAALQAGAPADTVTSIAVRWGFAHLSRFASSYAARFHERPSETLRRSRGAQPRFAAARV